MWESYVDRENHTIDELAVFLTVLNNLRPVYTDTQYV